MQCPKCDGSIADRNAVECPFCGVILAKASSGVSRSQFERVYRQPASAPPPPQASFPLSKILIVAAIVAVGWWIVQKRNASVAAADWYEGGAGADRAFSEQRAEKKTVLLYFHTEWCGYCKMLERDVFSTSKFSKRYPSIIKVRLNPEKSQRERELAAVYGIRGYPTVFVLPPDGGRSSIEGYGDSGGFYSRLDDALR